MKHKTCTHCMQLLPIDCFSIAKAYRDGRRSQCKACRVELASLRLQRNPEKKITPDMRRAYAEKREKLTADKLRMLLYYDQSTGVFTRKTIIAKRTKIGEQAGSVNRAGYLVISVDGGKKFAHRLAWLHVHGAWPSGVIDHIDGNRLNNRIGNLRDVDSRTNAQNIRSKNGASGLLGASYHPQTGKWKAQIRTQLMGNRYIGLFDTAEDAHAAYIKEKRLLHAGCTI